MIVNKRIASLDCVVVGPRLEQIQPELVCVLCHGFGAPGDDLVPLGVEFLNHEPALIDRVQFVFPAAPLSLAAQGLPDGRAWWHIDMMELQRAIETGQLRDLREANPPGLDQSRELLQGLVTQLTTDLQLPNSRVVLGGFSQGSMLATDLTLHLGDKPAGLIIYSGTLLNSQTWKSLADSCKGLKILQSHGRSDPLLPFVLAEELRDMFQKSEADIEFHPFPGMHTIPQIAFNATTRFLMSLIE